MLHPIKVVILEAEVKKQTKKHCVMEELWCFVIRNMELQSMDYSPEHVRLFTI